MEALTRLVSESLARHGFDRPVDYRRLQWSRWFRCESPHSLLFVPSKPGVFALAEEIVDLSTHREGPDFSRADGSQKDAAASAAEGFGTGAVSDSRKLQSADSRRMLAVAQFFETDDMAFVLDRMLSRQNPMRARLTSGRYFIRFVVIENESQRRSICSALNQWIVNSSEKATGIGSHFATSLELNAQSEETEGVAPALQSAPADTSNDPRERGATVEEQRFSPASQPTNTAALAAVDHPASPAAPQITSGAATNIHCPFPAGF